MKATRFEFRFRLAISAVIYVLGFWAPWLRFGPLAEENPTRLWSWLAIELARARILPIQTAYVLITAAVVVLAWLGAGLRVWGTAYLGRSVVFDAAMRAGGVVAAGPYRYVRNPLYLGSMLTAVSVSVLMPAGGVVFFLPALSLFVVRLVQGEEDFLHGQIGEAYGEYRKRVPRWLPRVSSRLPASAERASWLPALVGEAFPVGMAVCFLVFAWRYDSELLIRCVLICFGVSLVVRALRRG